MRQQDDLRARLPALVNLINRVIPPEAVEARKRIIENDDLSGARCILFQFRKEKRERQRAPVARTERVPKTRSVCRRRRIPNIDGVLIDDNLIARAWPPAPGNCAWAS